MAGSPSGELQEYFREIHTIRDQSDGQSDEDELSKTPDEGELEADWLNKAGYGFVVNTFQDGLELTEAEVDSLTHSLTRPQAQAVRRRISVLSTTMRKKQKVNKMHVRDIFPNRDFTNTDTSNNRTQTQQDVVLRHSANLNERTNLNNKSSNVSNLNNKGNNLSNISNIIISSRSKHGEQRWSSPLHKGGYSITSGQGRDSRELGGMEPGVEALSFHPRPSRQDSTDSQDQVDQFSYLPTVSDIEISLDFHLEETHPETPPISPTTSTPDPHRIDLPAFEPKPCPLGITLIGDLADIDMDKIRTLAHIELTALFDRYTIICQRSKRKKRSKDHGLFGVPLSQLVEQDQRRRPEMKIEVPLVFKAMIDFLEREGLCTEGILRVSGADARAKQLRSDLEHDLYSGCFAWGDAGPHDVAVVLKQFLRLLPVPLLSYDNLDAFPQVSSIPKTLEQLKALNLLILLLSDEHRSTLKVLLQFLRNIISHSNINKMGLSNVAMIMAPNLFVLSPVKRGGKGGDLELELKKAEGTSNIVRMLIHYQDVLWTVPNNFIAQIRHQYTTDAHRKSKERLLSRLPWKRDKDRSDIYKRPVSSVDQLHESPYDIGVIRVQAPHLTKSSAMIQLEAGMTAADVINKFKGDGTLDKGGGLIGNIDGSNGVTFRNPKNAQYAHDTDFLFEVGGNIAERCLDPRTRMLDLHHVNPDAEWIIRSRKGR